MGITPWPGGEWEKAYIVLLSFLELGSILVGLSGGTIIS